MLEAIEFWGGVELSSLGQGEFAGKCRIFLPLTPESVAAMPRGGTDDGLFGVLSTKARNS